MTTTKKKTGVPVRTFGQSIPCFWLKVDKLGKDECWEWKGCRHKEGYGRFKTDGKFISAHRFSYILHFGPIPLGLQVCHTCDNPPCCNPNHYFLGTKKDNADDRDRKGRNINRVGEGNGCAKVTAEQVLEMRAAYKPFINTAKMLAAKYNVSVPCIKFILQRRNWKHI